MHTDATTPPQSALVETLVLASCCDWTGCCDEVLAEVRSEDFTSEPARTVLAVVRMLRERKEAVTHRSVLRVIQAAGGDGVTQALAIDLGIELPDPDRVPQYIRELRELSARRRLSVSGDELSMAAKNGEDIGDLLGRLRVATEQAEGAAVVGYQPTLSRALDAVIAQLDEPAGQSAGLPTGLPDLDRYMLGMEPGQVIVIAGRPGMGKSLLALGIARHVALRAHRSVGLFSLEMPRREIGRRILAAETGIPNDRIRGGWLTDQQRDELRSKYAEIKGLDLFIDDSGALSPEELLARARRLQGRFGLDLALVDYLQLMTVEGRYSTREAEVSAISRRLKLTAMSLGVPLIAVAQLSRAPEARSDRRPILSDLRESGGIEADADAVLFLYRDSYYDQRNTDKTGEIIIAKQREGKTGIIGAYFDLERARITGLDRGRTP